MKENTTWHGQSMESYLQYYKYLYKHIKYVRKKCFDMWLYWQWIIHDWDKRLPSMYIQYAEHFYWDKRSLDRWWNSHQKLQKHHRQYWVLIEDSWNIKPLVMPERYIKEMLADWWWVGMTFLHDDEEAQEKYNIFDWWEVWNFYYNRRDKMILSIQTQLYIEDYLQKQLLLAKESLQYDGIVWRDDIWEVLYLKWLYEHPDLLSDI